MDYFTEQVLKVYLETYLVFVPLYITDKVDDEPSQKVFVNSTKNEEVNYEVSVREIVVRENVKPIVDCSKREVNAIFLLADVHPPNNVSSLKTDLTGVKTSHLFRHIVVGDYSSVFRDSLDVVEKVVIIG